MKTRFPAIRHVRAPRRARRRAFTLAEMLVILGIVLLVAAIALPAFVVIIGSRSVESARNIVAASLVRARGEAIRRGQPCGVYFYVDPDSGRTGVAIVTLDPLSDPDPYDEYKAFTRGTQGVIRDYQGGSYDPLNRFTVTSGSVPENEPSMTADRVLVLGSDANPVYAADPRYSAFAGRPIILTMQHTSQDTDPTTPVNDNPGLQNPGDVGPAETAAQSGLIDSSDVATMENALWGTGVNEVGSLELISGIQPELLAAGVGLQVILGQALETTATDGPEDADGFKYAIPGPGAPAPDPDDPEFLERYARAGLILFDSEGTLIQASYRIYASSRLGKVMGLDLVPDPASTANPPAPIEEYLVVGVTTLGVVLYENDAFESAPGDGTGLVWKGGFIASLADPPTPISDFRTTDGDVTFLYPPADRPIDLGTPPPAGDWRFHEYAEERWLDANTIPLMVNRYSGTLVAAE